MDVFRSLHDSDLVRRIKIGAVGILPTDTVYGVAGAADNPEAVERLYKLKHREGKPGTLIAADLDQLVGLGIKLRYLRAVERFWPGAVSVIVPTGPKLAYLHVGLQSLPVRIPADPAVHELLVRTGPLLTSSANQPGEPPATNIAEAQAYFGDQSDFYVDGGDLSSRPPSTIIRIVDDAVEVLRAGAVHINENGEN